MELEPGVPPSDRYPSHNLHWFWFFVSPWTLSRIGSKPESAKEHRDGSIHRLTSHGLVETFCRISWAFMVHITTDRGGDYTVGYGWLPRGRFCCSAIKKIKMVRCILCTALSWSNIFVTLILILHTPHPPPSHFTPLPLFSITSSILSPPPSTSTLPLSIHLSPLERACASVKLKLCLNSRRQSHRHSPNTYYNIIQIAQNRLISSRL